MPPVPVPVPEHVDVAASQLLGQSAMVGARQAPVVGSLMGVAAGQVVPSGGVLPPDEAEHWPFMKKGSAAGHSQKLLAFRI